MINKSDLISISHVALLGCITATLRMLKVLFSEDQKKVFVVAYFDSVPKAYEQELVSDIAGEIECSLIGSQYECRSVCVHSIGMVLGNVCIDKFESTLCESILFSEVCYLRFGEEGGYEDLTSDSYASLGEKEYYRLE